MLLHMDIEIYYLWPRVRVKKIYYFSFISNIYIHFFNYYSKQFYLFREYFIFYLKLDTCHFKIEHQKNYTSPSYSIVECISKHNNYQLQLINYYLLTKCRGFWTYKQGVSSQNTILLTILCSINSTINKLL